MIQKLFFALIFLSGSLFADEKIKLLWSDAEIDKSAVLQFRGMDENQIVTRIRNNGIKVIVLNLKENGIERVTVGNPKGLEEAELFFRTSSHELVSTPDAATETIESHFHHHQTPFLKDYTARPYESEDLILVRKSATRLPLIYAYLYAHLSKDVCKEKPFESEGTLHTSLCLEYVDQWKAKETLERLQKELAGKKFALGNESDRQKVETFLSPFLDQLLRANRLAVLIFGKKLDIYRTQFELGEELGLSKQEMVDLLNKIVATVNTLIEGFSGRAKHPTFTQAWENRTLFSLEIQEKLKEIERFNEEVNPKGAAFTEWLRGPAVEKINKMPK